MACITRMPGNFNDFSSLPSIQPSFLTGRVLLYGYPTPHNQVSKSCWCLWLREVKKQVMFILAPQLPRMEHLKASNTLSCRLFAVLSEMSPSMTGLMIGMEENARNPLLPNRLRWGETKELKLFRGQEPPSCHMYSQNLTTHLGGSVSKESAFNAGDSSSFPGSGRPLGERNHNPLLYSCLENSINREAWQAAVHGVAKSWTRLSD